MKPKILVFQHIAVEHPGVFRDFLRVQYHVEITEKTVPEWGAVPAYGQGLERALGPGALARFEADAAAGMVGFNRNARRLYDNFMRIVEAARAGSDEVAGRRALAAR